MTTEANPYSTADLPAVPLTPGEEKQWAILTHVLGIFFGAISAVVLFILYRNRGPFVRAHTMTEFNFQLTVAIVTAVGFVISFGSVFVSIIATAGQTSTATPPGIGLFFVGYFLIGIVRLAALIQGIRASLAASRGRYYKYPLAIPFAK